MALIPENYTNILDNLTTTEYEPPAPSKTWSIDFKNGRIGGFIDDKEALIQSIQLALMTERSKYAIFTDDYGNELMKLIGADVTPALLDAEIPRMVREALVYDDRIDDVVDIEYRKEGDNVFVSFRIIPSNGVDGFITEVTL